MKASLHAYTEPQVLTPIGTPSWIGPDVNKAVIGDPAHKHRMIRICILVVPAPRTAVKARFLFDKVTDSIC